MKNCTNVRSAERVDNSKKSSHSCGKQPCKFIGQEQKKVVFFYMLLILKHNYKSNTNNITSLITRLITNTYISVHTTAYI